MTRRRDPLQERAGRTHDLYDVATWEVRSRLDGVATRLYYVLLTLGRLVVVVLAAVMLLAQLFLGGLAAQLADPFVGLLTALSVVPAFLLAAYVWYADVTTGEPLGLIVASFALGVVFANFAGLFNSISDPLLNAIPVAGPILFFYLVVGPVEETVKLLAVRLYAYRSDRFDAVVDGAVYGAAAGLGFATIENVYYITQSLEGVEAVLRFGTTGSLQQLVGDGGSIAARRALAGPGHVIYSAFAGYYLGLAKFNPERAGPIVVKGLLVASLIHATYNTLVSFVPAIVIALVGLPPLLVFLGFVVVYDGVFGYVLYRKLHRYRTIYRDVYDVDRREEDAIVVEQTEFDPDGGEKPDVRRREP